MLLDQYMREREISDTELAAKIGVSQPYVWRIRKGYRRPSIKIATRIEDWSGGVVPATSFAEVENAA